ncbi:hypothetical protein JKF63_01791 [Porcisia hertigi]|uniref:Uncharacterized protein n=1 Tax=Porcisia hertigi TaxID=2761500 RepID=A0A836HLT9_9TRYP|nr:hypothetical protein JKF63_01791 [Porcisia hertigi]
MSSSLLPSPPGGGAVQIELVNPDGNPISKRPIRIEELLQQQDYSMDVGDGIALRLEALNADQDYSDDDSSAPDDAPDDDEEPRTYVDGASAGPPPGTQATTDWYDVLDALRREQADLKRTSTQVEKALSKPGDGEALLVTRHPKAASIVATPLKRFSYMPSSEPKSIGADATPTDLPPPHASRREVWASLAPAEVRRSRNYKILRYVSFMPALDNRRFRPSALAFHAAASYLSRQDRGQRFLVYGGVSFGARSVEQELYEFSLLTGNWRRIEGRKLVPAGHYGHTMTVAESVDRLVVVGGIGPGGAAVSKETRQAWCADPLRASRYETLCPLLNCRAGQAAATLAGAGGSATPLPSAPPAAVIGFVSLLFDMSLSDQTWRAIQPATPFPLAFHTTVFFGREVFVFGGLTEELYVSGKLLAINTETYAVRLVQTSAGWSRRGRQGTMPGEDAEEGDRGGGVEDVEVAGPEPRFLHTAVRYGPYMIVYGGYNRHNELLGDCWAFDMTNERWEQLRCRNEVAGRAGHECCMVGSRMLVTGGFESALPEVGAVASPSTTAMELNLVPTVRGEHIWRGEVRVHPPLPPLAFTRCAPCGDDHSFILFGGLTRPARHPSRSRSAKKRSGSAKDRLAARDGVGREVDAGVDRDADTERRHTSHNASEHGASLGPHNRLWKTLAPFDDGLVFTFPEKRPRRKEADKGERVLNALGVEVDPDELPESFKTFVRRQEDFLRKKDAAATETMRTTTLDEQEGMEPTLYLTDDEIELLIHRSEECCVAFAERYKMETLPGNVPDREERVRLIEACISDSRQVRDVMRSMKGSAPGVTAVKSKTHRKRAGQKFEDYSAAKPFRRVVVTHLIENITSHLSRMYRLNKALRTVDWPEKQAFIEAIDAMKTSLHSLSRTIGSIVNTYIQRRVDTLMKGVDKHKEVMRLLTQVVEKNRHDKIWCVEEMRNEKRQEHQRARAAVNTSGQPASTAKRTPSQRRMSSAAALREDSSPGLRRCPSTPSRSLGGGYHADESKAVLYMMDGEWNDLLVRATMVKKCADELRRYCEAGAATSSTAPLAVAPPPPPQLTVNVPFSMQPVQPPAPSLMNQAQSLLQAHSLTAVGSITPSLPAPPVFLPTGMPQGGSLTSTTPEVSPGVLPVSMTDGADTTRPRDIIIQRSNQLRKATATVAEEVRKTAVDFHRALTQETAEVRHPTASPSQTAKDTSATTHTIRGPEFPPSALVSSHLPAALTIAPGPTGVAHSSPLGTRFASSSESSRSSSSSSGSSAPAAAGGTQRTAVSLPLGGDSSVPEAAAPASGAGIADKPHLRPTTGAPSSHDAATGASHRSRRAKGAPPQPAQASTVEGHPVRLSALRPILEVKDSLRRLQEKVTLIRLNEWDNNDLSGAPQDVKVVELYNRLCNLLVGVAQRVTAGFLAKAGAKPPRLRSVSASVRPPQSQVKHKKTAGDTEKRGAVIKRASQSKSLTSLVTARADPTPAAFPGAPPTALEGNEAHFSSAQGHCVRAAALHDTAGVSSSDALRLMPLPPSSQGQCVDSHEWLPTKVSCPTDDGAVGVPLVSNDALLRYVRLQDEPAAAAPTSGGASAAVEVHPVYPGAPTMPNTSTTSAVRGSVTAPIGTGPWAPTITPMQRSGTTLPGVSASPVITLSVAPKVIMPVEENDRSTAEPGGAFATHSPLGRRRSTIKDLSQLRHPSQRRKSEGRADTAATWSSDGDEAVTREPVTSITRGNFVVNAEYLSRVAPHALPVALTTNEHTDQGAIDVQHAWADVDDDYFYFGRPVEKRMAPAGTVVAGPPYISTYRGSGVGVSPPVGEVVGSPRANAELVVPPKSRLAGVTSESAAPRPRSSTGHRLTRDRRVSSRYLSSTASQSLKLQTGRSLVRKEGAKLSFYTPGEMQLMQARERLRSKLPKTE